MKKPNRTTQRLKENEAAFDPKSQPILYSIEQRLKKDDAAFDPKSQPILYRIEQRLKENEAAKKV